MMNGAAPTPPPRVSTTPATNTTAPAPLRVSSRIRLLQIACFGRRRSVELELDNVTVQKDKKTNDSHVNIAVKPVRLTLKQDKHAQHVASKENTAALQNDNDSVRTTPSSSPSAQRRRPSEPQRRMSERKMALRPPLPRTPPPTQLSSSFAAVQRDIATLRHDVDELRGAIVQLCQSTLIVHEELAELKHVVELSIDCERKQRHHRAATAIFEHNNGKKSKSKRRIGTRTRSASVGSLGANSRRRRSSSSSSSGSSSSAGCTSDMD